MANQIVVSAGAKVRNLDGVLTATSGIVSSVPLGAANGVATLDSGGKVPVSQLPSSVVTYLGTWNATTNTPTLTNGVGDAGDMYICNVAGTVNFGAGPITFAVGDWVLYGSGTWQKSNGQNGTVTSVGLSTNGGAITIGSSPITTSGTITANFNGTNLQYVNGAGNLTTFPTLITSIGLSMPSAFSVANSPLTANGTIAVTGAGYASQYIRGDGTLADFPSSGGGGSSVSYYLNGGTSQGTIGGTTYYEMSKTADTGTGVDFTKSGDGFIVAFLTDANDPAQLNIPAGNWNYEIYASMSANGGTPQMYAELYKYDGTTFTLISTSTNEILYDGTNLNLYTFGMTVPATTLALTDRLAIKLYATNSGGKTTTVHTQDSHLCQVITTFSTGITALNGLTAQVQYFATGTSGTDFNISSTTATHTFNIPDASATARGLITTGTQTIAGIKTFSSGINVDYIGVTGDIGMDGSFSLKQVAYGTLQSGYTNLSGQTNGLRVGLFGGYNALLNFSTSGSYTYTFPNATGTIALTSDIPSLAGYVTLATTQTITGAKTFSGAVTLTSSVTTNNLTFANSGFFLTLQPPTLSVNRTVTLPDATGTLALTSDLTPYALNSEVVKLTGNQTIAGLKTFSVYTTHEQGALIKHGINLLQSGYTGIGASTLGLVIGLAGGGLASLNFNNTTSYTYTFPNATGTIALVGGSGVGTVTSVAALTIGTSGTDLSSSVANSTTTPVITLNVPTASATNRGALSSADWTTFNNKQNALTNPVTGTGTTNYLPKFTGTSTIGNSALQDDGSTVTITSLTKNVGEFRIYPSSGTAVLRFGSGSTEKGKLSVDTSSNMIFETGGYERMRLDTSGNLGLGVTPSASGTNTRALQLTNYGTLSGNGNIGSMSMAANAYESADNSWNRVNATSAGLYQISYSGQHSWSYTGASTANSGITWTQAMTLTASGNLSIGVINPNTRLHIKGLNQTNGTVQFEPDAAKGIESSFIHYGATGDWYIRSASTSGKVIINDGGGNVLIGTTTDAGLGKVQSSGAISVYSGGDYWRMGVYTIDAHGNGTGGNFNIGTNSNDNLVLFTNNTTRLTIANSGAATFSAATSGNTLTVNGVAGSFATRVNGSSTTGSSYGIGIFAGTNSSDDSFRVHNYSGTEYFRVRGDGNVGIGTSSPAVKFEVAGSGSTAFFRNPSSTAATTYITVVNANNTSNGLVMAHISDGTGYFGTQNSADLRLVTGDTERMRITSGGNVLIGTTTDSGALLNMNFTSSGNVALNINRTSSGAGYFYNFAIGGSQKQYSYYNGSTVEFGVIGTITASAFYESSDSRLKKLIQDNYQTKGIASITPKLYTKNGKVELGYYAQDFIGILDSAVSKGSDDMLSLSYREVLVAKVYALEQEIKELKAKMN